MQTSYRFSHEYNDIVHNHVLYHNHAVVSFHLNSDTIVEMSLGLETLNYFYYMTILSQKRCS